MQYHNSKILLNFLVYLSSLINLSLLSRVPIGKFSSGGQHFNYQSIHK
jgi:hypothetical protein